MVSFVKQLVNAVLHTEHCVGCPQQTQIAGASETADNSPHMCLPTPIHPLYEMLTHNAPAD